MDPSKAPVQYIKQENLSSYDRINDVVPVETFESCFQEIRREGGNFHWQHKIVK